MKRKYSSLVALAVAFIVVPIQLMAQKPVSFVYHHSLIFLKVKVNEKKDLLFLMDTGANISSIDKSICSLLQLPAIREGDSVAGTAGKEAITLCKTKSLQMGGLLLKGTPLASRDLSRFTTPGKEKLAGIIGTDILKKYAITIDYAKKTILFSKAKPKLRKEKVVHFEMAGGIPLFETRLNDTLTTFVNYNSGVGLAPSHEVYVNVSHKQWSDLQRTDKFLKPYSSMTGDGVGGRVQLPVVKIFKVHFNGLEVEKPSLVVQPREGSLISDNAVGFFGNNLLEKYRKVTIDFLSNRMILHSINNAVAVHTIKRR